VAESDGEPQPLNHVVVAGATRELRRIRQPDGSTAVVKVVHHGTAGNPRWRPSDDVADAYYWKREPLAYASGLLAREYNGPLRAPRVVSVDDHDGLAVAITMEDVGGVFAPDWPLEHYRVAARHLGQMQGRYLVDRPLPTEPWLSRDFIRAYNQRHGVQHNEFLAVHDRLPRAFVQHDLHPGNLFAAPDGTTVAIDWAFSGLSAFADDAANLVLDTMLDVVVDARADARRLYDNVVEGFTDGLRDAGWDGDGALVAFAVDVGMIAKFLWFDDHHHTIVDVADAREAVERKYGQPFDEVHAQRTAAMAFMHERAGAARASRLFRA